MLIMKIIQYNPIHIFQHHSLENSEMEVELSTIGIEVIAWLLTLSPINLIIVIGIYQIWNRKKLGKPIGLALFQSTHNWKPAVERIIVIEDRYLKRRTRDSFRKHLPKHSELF